jgi:NAD(P)-dependent dehydrogenase (short-subunit alcohol dehydrogenase family)
MRNVKGRNAAVAREIEDLAKRESLCLQSLELDVTDDVSVDRAVSKIVLQCARLDILVNNAGYGIVDLAESITLAQAQRQFDTNFFGILRMNRAVLPAMKRQGSGLLLHVSSGAGRLVIPGMGLYCASKFAVEALAEVYRYELASQGIDSVVIEPGAYPTPIMTKLERGEDPARKKDYGEVAKIPEKVQGLIASSQANPQEIADAALQIIETPAKTPLSRRPRRLGCTTHQRSYRRNTSRVACCIRNHPGDKIQDARQWDGLAICSLEL